MRNSIVFLIFIITATAVCAYYLPDESVSDTGDVLDAEIDPESLSSDGDQVILIRNKRARFDSFYGSSIDSAESPGGQLYYQPLFRYRQTKKKRRRLFVPNLWG